MNQLFNSVSNLLLINIKRVNKRLELSVHPVRDKHLADSHESFLLFLEATFK